MNICLFHDSLNLEDNTIKGIQNFTNYFIKKKFNIIILTESVKHKEKMTKINLDNSIKFYSINENIDSSTCHDKNIINEYSTKYKDTKLLQERLSILSSQRSLFFKNNKNFENLLVSHLIFLENLLTTNKIDYIFAGILNSYQTYNHSILESFAKLNNIKYLIYQNPIQRTRVYDNQLRVSEEVNSNYEKNLTNGLSDSERTKTLDFFNNYKSYLTSKEHYDYVYKRTHRKLDPNIRKIENSIKFRIKKQIKKILRPNIKKINFCQIDQINTNYSILLLSKHNNYRLFKFSPFFSNTSSLIRSISLALPMNHELLIKLHPHDININITNPNLIDEVYLHHNIKILDPQIKLTNIIKNSKIVFASSSTSAILEALIFYKHVITFGNDLHHIGTYQAPIQRVVNYEDLNSTIDYCLNNNIDKEKILFFMNAFLKGSNRRDYDDDFSTSKFSYDEREIMYIKAAERLYKYISNIKNKIYNN